MFDDSEYSHESPFDDSDNDPDFNPNETRKKVFDFFGLNKKCKKLKADCDKSNEAVPEIADVDVVCNDAEAVSHGSEESSGNHQLDENKTDDYMEFINQIIDIILNNTFDTISLKTIKRTKKPNIREKYILLPPCKDTCRRQCNKKFDEKLRKQIFTHFWNLKFSERRLFLDSYAKQENVRVRIQEAINSTRNYSNKYFLPSSDIKQSVSNTQVCKTMFLHTLGLKTDGMITTHFKLKNKGTGLAKIQDDRGAVSRSIKTAMKEERSKSVEKHINSYYPVVTHYNLSHALHRKYLPSELSIRSMWKEYCEIQKVSYDSYRKIFEQQNIGFSRPSQDECETCTKYKAHEREIKHADVHNNEMCKECTLYEEHRKKYTLARQNYQNDKTRILGANEDVYSVDMQKVLILPKMNTKNSYFVSRLVVFNETFAAVRREKDNLCVVWNEGIRGRCAGDVTSAYYNFMKKSDPSIMDFTFWVDNCSAQNKNWLFYSVLVTIVNATWGPETITLKYFEPGHSFMSADSVHGQISSEMRKNENIFDMDDMIRVIEKSCKRNKVLYLKHSDFIPFEDGSKQRKKAANGEPNMPFLEKIKIVHFKKGCRKLFYKENMSQLVYSESDFLKKKFPLSIPEAFTSPVGLNTTKKQKIISTLCPLMPARKRLFWEELPINDNARDLCSHLEHN